MNPDPPPSPTSDSERLLRRHVEALTRTLDALAGESSPDRLLEHVLCTMTEQLDAHGCSLWHRTDDGEALEFQFAFEGGRVLGRAEAGRDGLDLRLPTGPDWPWSAALRTGQLGVIIDDIGALSACAWQPRLLALGVVTVLVVPMTFAGRVDGLIGVRFRGRRSLRHEEIVLAHALANQARLALQLTRLAQHSRASAVIEERNRMARDIHDTLAQGFTGVIVQLEAAEDAASRGLDAEARRHVRRASDLARASLHEARRSVRALRPLALENQALCEALEAMIRKMTAGTRVAPTFAVAGAPHTLPPEWDENLLRVVQEVLTNVLRHAQASRFAVQMAFAAGRIHLVLSDDGRGFEPAAQHDGFGLLGIRERVEAMHGELSIESATGRGTTVRITLPDESPAASTES